jgi:AcrR family transcriptional regulator
MGRPRQHDETTARALLDASESRLKDGGLDGVSLRAIADDAGVSVRAVYSLFGDKDGLVATLAARALGRLADRIAGLPATDDPVADLVNAGCVGFREVALEHPETYRLTWERIYATAPGSASRGTWAPEGRQALQALLAWVRRAFPDEPAATVPHHDIAAGFHAVCQGLASCEINGVFTAMRVRNPARLWRDTLAAYVAGLSRTTT